MIGLFKYAEEAATLDSIMNFEENARVEYQDMKGTIVTVAGKNMRVQFDGGHFETIHYSRLHVTSLPETHKETLENGQDKWSEKDLNFLRQNISLPNSNLARLLGRSEKAVKQKKQKLESTT